VAACAAVPGAALVRVGGGLLLSPLYLYTIPISAALWALGFGLYAIHYWPILTRSRLDGLPG
jgi:uncharacterized protein involved in response to NO